MLQLKLSQYVFGTYDYGRNVTFKIYDETDTAFDASTYTGKIKVMDEMGSQIISDITPSWTTQTSGIGTFAFTNTLKPSYDSFLWIEASLTKSGVEISTEPVRIRIRRGPSA